jgi:hypothetical protein
LTPSRRRQEGAQSWGGQPAQTNEQRCRKKNASRKLTCVTVPDNISDSSRCSRRERIFGRRGREVEGTPLLREHLGQNLDRGFESLRLRQNMAAEPRRVNALRGFCFVRQDLARSLQVSTCLARLTFYHSIANFLVGRVTGSGLIILERWRSADSIDGSLRLQRSFKGTC